MFHEYMTQDVTKCFLKYKLLTSMAEFVAVSTSQNSSQFNSNFDNFRKPRQELKDKVRNFFFDFSIVNLRINCSMNLTAACGFKSLSH